MHPVQLSGAQVLPGVGGRHGAHGVIGRGKQTCHLAGGRHGGHGHGAQTVDRRLQQNGADGGNGVLQPHGQAHDQQPPDAVAPPEKIFLFQMQNGELPVHIQQAQQPGDQLADERCPARTGHAHLQGHHAHNVQGHIQQAGKHQKHQRRPAVPQGAENAGEQIVEHGGRNAQEDQENIVIGIGEGALRGIHGGEDRTAADGGDRRNNQRNDAAQPDHIAHEIAQAVEVLLAEFLSHGNGKPGADAVAQAQHQEIDGARGANPRQGLHAQEIAHNHRIHHGIELLKQQPQQQRQNKRQQYGHGRAHSHVSCPILRHIFSSPKMLYQAQIVPPFFPAVNPGKINKNT